MTESPKSATVAETQSATFECQVSHLNVPPTWLKSGAKIQMSEKLRMTVRGKVHQLNIVDADGADSAEYTFVCGDHRVSATLTVCRKFGKRFGSSIAREDKRGKRVLPKALISFLSLFAAILISAALRDINAQEKDAVTFEVDVNYEGICPKWLKNGVEIRSSDRCQARCKQQTHTLSIRSVHFGDAAEYAFVAGQARTDAKLSVEGKRHPADTD